MKKILKFIGIIIIIGVIINIFSSDDEKAPVKPKESTSIVVPEDTEEVKAEKIKVEAIKAEEPEKVEIAPPVPANPFANDDRETSKTIVTDKANETWGTDFQMVAYEIDLQMKEYDALKLLVIDTETKETIIKKAYDTWGSDYQMVKYEYDLQLEAFNKLNQ